MLPYVMYSIEELSMIKDLSHWGNLNVQFVGRLIEKEGTYRCLGMQKKSTENLLVDFSLSENIPPRNTLVRVWGVIQLVENENCVKPCIKIRVSADHS
jgi:hypothetical protein